MPQLNGGGGDDLGANDEMISFKDEGEQEEKISENSSAERDLADVKSSLVNESETNQNSSSDSEAERRPPPRSETFRDKSRESLEEVLRGYIRKSFQRPERQRNSAGRTASSQTRSRGEPSNCLCIGRVTSFVVQSTSENGSGSGTYSYHESEIGMPTYNAF
ncbi:UNVERIFIED_CONTAM: hypothetical protein FKN15_077519 [Acipenser sinensis]